MAFSHSRARKEGHGWWPEVACRRWAVAMLLLVVGIGSPLSSLSPPNNGLLPDLDLGAVAGARVVGVAAEDGDAAGLAGAAAGRGHSQVLPREDDTLIDPAQRHLADEGGRGGDAAAIHVPDVGVHGLLADLHRRWWWERRAPAAKGESVGAEPPTTSSSSRALSDLRIHAYVYSIWSNQPVQSCTGFVRAARRGQTRAPFWLSLRFGRAIELGEAYPKSSARSSPSLPPVHKPDRPSVEPPVGINWLAGGSRSL